VKALLDTNVFLWLNDEPERLGDAIARLSEPETLILVSAVVSWEIAIKYAIGRLQLPLPPERYMPERIGNIGASSMVIEHRDALGVAALPPIHRDPFDRLLVAQAINHSATLVTTDRRLGEYPVDALVV